MIITKEELFIYEYDSLTTKPYISQQIVDTCKTYFNKMSEIYNSDKSNKDKFASFVETNRWFTNLYNSYNRSYRLIFKNANPTDNKHNLYARHIDGKSIGEWVEELSGYTILHSDISGDIYYKFNVNSTNIFCLFSTAVAMQLALSKEKKIHYFQFIVTLVMTLIEHCKPSEFNWSQIFDTVNNYYKCLDVNIISGYIDRMTKKKNRPKFEEGYNSKSKTVDKELLKHKLEEGMSKTELKQFICKIYGVKDRTAGSILKECGLCRKYKNDK